MWRVPAFRFGRAWLPSVVTLAVFFAAVFFLNSCTLFYDDDLGYAAMARGGWTCFWRSFALCPHRPVPHFLLRLFCGVLGETAFDVLNTLVWIPVLSLVSRVAVGRWMPPPLKMILAAGCAFFLLFTGETCLWAAGSCNYLWMSVPFLLFLLARRAAEAEDGVPPEKMAACAGVALVAGWCQEGLSLPLAFACGADALVFRRWFNARRLVLWAAFAAGLALLLREALGYVGGNLRPEPLVFALDSFGLAKRLLQTAAGVKAAWPVAALWLLSADRPGFLKRNAFELFVIAGSTGLILTVGYYGERSLWAANLAAVVVIVREFTPGPRLRALVPVALAALLAALAAPALKIEANRVAFRKSYLAAPTFPPVPVVVHEPVERNPLFRWIFQPVYLWDASANPNVVAGWFFRRPAPIVLQPPLYRDLYVKDALCVPANRLPIAGEFYTRPDVNAVVTPLRDGRVPARAVVDVSRSANVAEWAARQRAAWRVPSSFANPRAVQVLETRHGKYLLVAKPAGCDGAIRSVVFE